VLRVLALLALCSCDTLYSAAVEGEADYGTVYVCATGQGCVAGRLDEYCFEGPREDLEALLGAECHRIGFGERAWPALVGCAYCCGAGCGAGANAACGSVCEAP
jgi:hypothetical protein